MNKITTLLLCISFCYYQASAQDEKITTFILVRHAEKSNESNADPDLSPEGKARVEKLAALLRDTRIDAVYTTNYKRTRNTVVPIAEAKGLQLKTYEPLKADVLNDILSNAPGSTVLISGHSNTIPWTANWLIGKDELKNFTDSEYDNLLIISVTGQGKSPKVTWLHY
jgi:2,3-bisphosphoglycerate-dependent phosphoglycerate mutase